MKKIIMLAVISSLVLLFGAFSGSAADEKQRYQAKVKENDQTIGVIAGVINYICPKLVEKSDTICKEEDPVGSAVAIQKTMGDLETLDEMYEDELAAHLKKQGITHKDAAMQFFDAVEQFKVHYQYRQKAQELAKAGDYQEALLNEEMAWQYLVKTASRGIFAKKMVDGE